MHVSQDAVHRADRDVAQAAALLAVVRIIAEVADEQQWQEARTGLAMITVSAEKHLAIAGEALDEA